VSSLACWFSVAIPWFLGSLSSPFESLRNCKSFFAFLPRRCSPPAHNTSTNSSQQHRHRPHSTKRCGHDTPKLPAVSEPFSVFIAAIKTVPHTILRTVSARRSAVCRNHETRCLTHGLVDAVAMLHCGCSYKCTALDDNDDGEWNNSGPPNITNKR
jgi:hypothetical protein